MTLLEKHLFIKKSGIPKAGKGLFTKQFIAKGTRIIEYKGIITTWKKVLQTDEFNGYVFYINRNHVIDARPLLRELARYVNDAKGINKIKGLRNNTKYVKEDGRVFIHTIKNVAAGSEILVSYQKEYWDVIRYNNRLLKPKKKSIKVKK
ncbi:MAG: SET domain-containing protein [Bacteroidota bacterium]|nr:SET domain-containing protein [Bacteroidota bacterium]